MTGTTTPGTPGRHTETAYPEGAAIPDEDDPRRYDDDPHHDRKPADWTDVTDTANPTDETDRTHETDLAHDADETDLTDEADRIDDTGRTHHSDEIDDTDEGDDVAVGHAPVAGPGQPAGATVTAEEAEEAGTGAYATGDTADTRRAGETGGTSETGGFGEPADTGTIYAHGDPVHTDTTSTTGSTDAAGSTDTLGPTETAGSTGTIDAADTAGATDTGARTGTTGAGGAAGGDGWWPGEVTDEVMGRWREAQIAFVDDPEGAVRQGREAVEDAVRRFAEALSSRGDRLAAGDAGGGTGDTERLRQLMRDYHQLLDRLVEL
jgi:hypothetical protein